MTGDRRINAGDSIAVLVEAETLFPVLSVDGMFSHFSGENPLGNSQRIKLGRRDREPR